MCTIINNLLIKLQVEHESSDAPNDPSPEEIEDYAKKFTDLRSRLDEEVKSNVGDAQKKQKKYYDAKHQQGTYEVGSLVLVKNMRKLTRKGGKMDPNWTGPYEVVECVGSNNYRLRRRNGKQMILKSLFNSDRLKDFNERGTVL